MSDLLAIWLCICNDTLIIYDLIAKMPPFYSINLAVKRNLRNLNKGLPDSVLRPFDYDSKDFKFYWSQMKENGSSKVEEASL